VQPTQPEASENDFIAARFLEQVRRLGEVLSDAFACGVKRSKVRASGHLISVAGVLEKRRRSGEIPRYTRALFVQNPEPRATVHGILFTSTLEQGHGTS
jgi:hypothetical protein